MPGYDISKVKFMLVEDNKHMRRLIKAILTAFNVKTILELDTGEGALNEMRIFKPDVVICDWEMEPVSGITFVKNIRNSPKSPDPFVPIIMLTGHSEMRRVLTARDAGITEYLAKPVVPKELFARIRTMIENPRIFVRTPSYFGPDRRRKQVSFDGKEKRKNTSNDMKAIEKAKSEAVEREKNKLDGRRRKAKKA